jgi:F-box and leucine-rich repeat protein GRR1
LLTYIAEFNDHQRDVFCVFSNHGVSRLRSYLNADSRIAAYEPDGTMYDESEEPDVIMNVTAQAHIMAIDEMDEEFGENSEMMGQD